MVKLNKTDSILLRKISGSQDTLFSFNSGLIENGASLTKIVIALGILKKTSKVELKEKILIKETDLAGYGTDILSDLYNSSFDLYLDVETLIGLMLKYSCNSSTLILARKFFPDRGELEKISKKYFGLKDVILVDKKGTFENKISLDDMYKLYRYIFSRKSYPFSFIKKKMRESRSIYYLFDQMEVKILASKTGTLYQDGLYIVGDTGVVNIDGEKYFLGVIVRREHISDAVKQVRLIGKDLIKSI